MGDRVVLKNGESAVVVCSMDSAEYSPDFPEAEWAYLKRGVMIRTEAGALIHYEDPNHRDFDAAPTEGSA